MDGFCALAGAQSMVVRLESSVLKQMEQQTEARSSQSTLGRTAQHTVQGKRRPQARCLYVDSRTGPADAQHNDACTTRSRNPHLHEKKFCKEKLKEKETDLMKQMIALKDGEIAQKDEENQLYKEEMALMRKQIELLMTKIGNTNIETQNNNNITNIIFYNYLILSYLY